MQSEPIIAVVQPKKLLLILAVLILIAAACVFEIVTWGLLDPVSIAGVVFFDVLLALIIAWPSRRIPYKTVLQGQQLTTTSVLGRRTIDLQQIIAVAPVVTSGIARLSMTALRLTDGAGKKLYVHLAMVKPADRSALAAAVKPYLFDNPAVKIVRPRAVAMVFNAWLAPTQQKVVVPPLTPEEQKHQVKSVRIAGIIGLLVLIVAVGSIVWTITSVNQVCNELRTNGRIATATVTQVSLFQKQYRNVIRPVSDLAQATQISITVTYNVNGNSYTEVINSSYGDSTYKQMLYKQALTGSLEVTYLPSDPKTVHPALETEAGAPPELCNYSY